MKPLKRTDYSQMKYHILPDTHPILKQVAKEVVDFGPELKTMINLMLFTMDADGGIGLAAPQIGKSLRVFVMRARPENHIAYYFINPKIISFNFMTEPMVEGCLSVKGRKYKCDRPTEVTVQYQMLDQSVVTETLTGLSARVFQHEYDHLEGKLISDVGIKSE